MTYDEGIAFRGLLFARKATSKNIAMTIAETIEGATRRVVP